MEEIEYVFTQDQLDAVLKNALREAEETIRYELENMIIHSPVTKDSLEKLPVKEVKRLSQQIVNNKGERDVDTSEFTKCENIEYILNNKTFLN